MSGQRSVASLPKAISINRSRAFHISHIQLQPHMPHTLSIFLVITAYIYRAFLTNNSALYFSTLDSRLSRLSTLDFFKKFNKLFLRIQLILNNKGLYLRKDLYKNLSKDGEIFEDGEKEGRGRIGGLGGASIGYVKCEMRAND